MYSYHFLLISSSSVRSIPFLFFIEPIFPWNVPLFSAVQQYKSAIILYINMYQSPPFWTSLPSPQHTPLGHHKGPGWAPCATQQAKRKLSYAWWYIYVDATYSIRPILFLLHSVYKSILHMCLHSLCAIRFIYIYIYIYTISVYLFSSFWYTSLCNRL